MQAKSMALNIQVKKKECLQWSIALYNVICGISPHLTVHVSPGEMPTLPQTCSACLGQQKLAVKSGTQQAMHVGVLCGIISAFLLCLCWSQIAKLVQQSLRLVWYLPAMLCLWYLHLEDIFPASGLFSSSKCKLSLTDNLKKMTCFRNNPSYFRKLFPYTKSGEGGSLSWTLLKMVLVY